MKTVLLVFVLLGLPFAVGAQTFSPTIDVLTVHSQNGRFYLRSIPFDNELPTTRGVTRVYSTSQSEPLYEFDRGFDSVEQNSNNLILSDDGETILYAIALRADQEDEGLTSVTIYKHGRIHRSYTETDIDGCGRRERCSSKYSNYAQVVDRVKSGTWPNYRKVLKDDIPEEERFLANFVVFSNGDTVYLTDSKKRTHLFDLKEGVLASSAAFEDLYDTMKGLARFTKVEVESYGAREYDGFRRLDGLRRLKNGVDTATMLAAHPGMKIVDPEKWNRQYKRYDLVVRGNLRRDGSFELENIQGEEGLPKDKIVEFFTARKFDFDRLGIPTVFEKIHLYDQRFYLMRTDDRLARRERQEELKEEERFERGASAVLHEDRLVHLDEKGRIRVWRLQDGGFDAAASVELAGDDLTRLASDGQQLWAMSASNVYRWASRERSWKSAARVSQKSNPVKGFAVVGGQPLLVFRTEVVNPVSGRRYKPPAPGPGGLLRSTGSLADTVALLGTESQLWIGTARGEWGGRLYGLNPVNGNWAEYIDPGLNVTGITQAGRTELIVSWAMSQTMIRSHGPDGKPSREYPELEAQYYETVAFNPLDSKLYGIEDSDVVTISGGKPTTIADLDDPVYRKERLALSVTPGNAKLLPFAPGALVVVPKIGNPWLLRDGKLTRLAEP